MATKTPKAKTTKAKKAESTQTAKTYPHITVGTHLTVTEFEDGSTVLAWDDEALEREVREAIASVK